MEHLKFIVWRIRFGWRLLQRTHCMDVVKAESALWDFGGQALYNWRECDPVWEADEALTYYGD